MMRGMASKSIFESKYGSRERRATRQNIAENLNKCEEFALAARSLRDQFITVMKRYKLKAIQEVKGTRLASEELSENEQLLEELTERL